jgi:hypothetical protein
MKNTIKLFTLGALALVCGVASAENRGGFFDVDAINGITVIESNAGLTYEIILNAGATVEYQSVIYHVTDITGFWTLSDDDDLTSTAATQNGWATDNNNSGTGGIAGWKAPNTNSGMVAGDDWTFNYSTLNVGSVERLGFHMRFAENFAETGGLTASVTGPINPVPEPASLAALGVGALGLLRRRNRR